MIQCKKETTKTLSYGRQMRTLDMYNIVAVAWIIFAMLFTIIFGAYLGARGWLWLSVHHLFCFVSAIHSWKRYQHKKRAHSADSSSKTICAGQAEKK